MQGCRASDDDDDCYLLTITYVFRFNYKLASIVKACISLKEKETND
jgi:hypothetical protein